MSWTAPSRTSAPGTPPAWGEVGGADRAIVCAPRGEIGDLQTSALVSTDGALDRWTAERDRIYEQVMDRGRNAQRQAFVQHYGIQVLDASLLRMPRVGFIAPKDPMWLATLDAMDDELVTDSLVYRYDPAASPDGLHGSEGTFSLCSFAWNFPRLSPTWRSSTPRSLSTPR